MAECVYFKTTEYNFDPDFLSVFSGGGVFYVEAERGYKLCKDEVEITEAEFRDVFT